MIMKKKMNKLSHRIISDNKHNDNKQSDNKHNDLESLFSALDKYDIEPSEIEKKVYMRAKALLCTYKKVFWMFEESMHELDTQVREYIGVDLAFAVEILDKFDYRINRNKFDEKMICKAEIKDIIELIIRALLKVKSFPDMGQRYFYILNKNFFVKEAYSEAEIISKLDISRATYYRQYRDAIKVFGHCLWHIVLPDKETSESVRSLNDSVRQE